MNSGNFYKIEITASAQLGPLRGIIWTEHLAYDSISAEKTEKFCHFLRQGTFSESLLDVQGVEMQLDFINNSICK